MNTLMVEKDSGTEDIKERLRQRIAALTDRMEKDRKDLVDLKRSLEALGDDRAPSSGMYRGVSSIDAILVYLNMAGGPVDEEQLVRDLVREGAGRGKAAKTGGPESALRKSITQFLKTGRGSESTPLLKRDGNLIGLSSSLPGQ